VLIKFQVLRDVITLTMPSYYAATYDNTQYNISKDPNIQTAASHSFYWYR